MALGHPVMIVEGEKDVEALRTLGFPATTNPQGVGKWQVEYNEYFRDALVAIIPDNDDAGRNHAEAVATSLHGTASRIKMIELPELPHKGDVSDWIAAGGTAEALTNIRTQTADWQPGITGLSRIFTFVGDTKAAVPKEIVKGLLPAEGVAVTGGQTRAGKTFTEIYKAVCLERGLSFFGHKIAERVGTAFVFAEGRGAIPNRFAAAREKLSLPDKLAITWVRDVPDLSSIDGLKAFISHLRALNERYLGDFGVRLGQVVIDTVAATFGMKDEDDNAEAQKVCNVLRRIGEATGALTCPVHHYGKNPESGLRGASAWTGSADVVEGVLADIDPLSGRTSDRELVCVKQRDGEQGPLSPFDLEFIPLGQDEDGDIYGSCCVIPTQGQSRFDKTAKLSKGARAVLDAIAEALDGRGKLITPRPDMGPVLAARVTDVRSEFDRRYVVDEIDPAKAANTKRMAFKRALDRLSPTQFGAGSAEGADWIWRAQS
jgi:hypothetical protein